LQSQRVVILGAGGAALAIAGALQDRHIGRIAIANRTPERIAAVRRKLGGQIEALPWENCAATLSECELVINTTSLGMEGQPPLQLQLDRLPPRAAVADIVYTPLKTPLLIDAERRGNTIVGGLGMLLHQAVRGFSLWFGVKPQVTAELYDLVARDIDPGYVR
jgi:shikimate dehydrogenase